jgi:hypothetical protein
LKRRLLFHLVRPRTLFSHHMCLWPRKFRQLPTDHFTPMEAPNGLFSTDFFHFLTSLFCCGPHEDAIQFAKYSE